jgi:hypothetical protein
MSHRGRIIGKLFKHGSVLAFSVPSEVIHAGQYRRGDLFAVSRFGDSIVYTPIGDAVNARVGAAITDIERAARGVQP